MGEHVHASDLDIWTEQVGEGPDVLLIGGAGDTVESWQFQLDGLADRYRLTAFDNRGRGARRCPTAGIGGGDGGRRRRGSPGARDSVRPRRGLLRGQHRLPGAGPPPHGARPQPGAAEHLAGDGPLPSLVGPIRPLAARGRTERARLPRGLLPRHLHGAGAQRRHRRPVHRGGARLSAQAVGRGPAARRPRTNAARFGGGARP